MSIHHCIASPCPVCSSASRAMTATVATAWNGGCCGVCGALYLGSHQCSIEDLMRRSDELRDMALRKFWDLNPEPTHGPPEG